MAGTLAGSERGRMTACTAQASEHGLNTPESAVSRISPVAYSSTTGGPGRGGPGERAGSRGRIDPYPLVVRPFAAAPPAAPIVDMRSAWARRRRGAGAGSAWAEVIDGLRAFAGAGSGEAVELETIKPFDSRRGADHDELDRVLAALDAGQPVGFFGWWPSEVTAETTEILGVDAIEVLPPDRKGAGLVERPRRRDRRLRAPRRIPGWGLPHRPQQLADLG